MGVTNGIELSPDEKTLYVGESTIGSTPARLHMVFRNPCTRGAAPLTCTGASNRRARRARGFVGRASRALVARDGLDRWVSFTAAATNGTSAMSLMIAATDGR